VIEVVAIVGFLIAALAAAQWLRARARLREALLGRDAVEHSRAALAAVLDTVPVAALWWRRDGSEENAVGAVPGSGAGAPYSRFLTALTPADAARLSPVVERLRETGAPFAERVSLSAGPEYRSPDGERRPRVVAERCVAGARRRRKRQYRCGRRRRFAAGF
jgi:hypothetical protein